MTRLLIRFQAAALLAGSLLSAQNASSPSPFPALNALAAKDCQPSQPEGVPPKARENLELFKDRLGPWILERLTALGEAAPAELGQKLASELDSELAGLLAPEGSFWHPLRFQVENPKAHPELLVVTARFGIDATLLLFHRAEGGWKLLWQDRAPAFWEINGAFGSYAAVMTPKDPEGAFFLAAARITPWYQSHWRGAELRVFRIGTDGSARRIGQREESVFLGVEKPMSLEVQGAQDLVFRVRAASIDPSRHTFPRVLHLRVSSSGLTRMPPYAETPLDLVDEWLSLPWAEASALAESASLKKLKPLHAYLNNRDENLLSFDEEDPLRDQAGSWEVHAELERGEKLEHFAFRIGKAGEDLRLLDVFRRKP